MYPWPCLLIPVWRSLPPLQCALGVSPSERDQASFRWTLAPANNWRAERKRLASGTFAAIVLTQGKSAHATRSKVAMSVTMDDPIKRWTAKRS
ncbi:hypothetical protein C8J28_13615 [Cereibacter azotoformans]|uniref:Uncharacterized protein n=1 Tax=Cereibacter azotoformans TaxID=43057 RepID=A0A2T5JML3_9RHOB|nr:hypothetical protein C8J28_13615 [Cereibacter azotoformans]